MILWVSQVVLLFPGVTQVATFSWQDWFKTGLHWNCKWDALMFFWVLDQLGFPYSTVFSREKSKQECLRAWKQTLCFLKAWHWSHTSSLLLHPCNRIKLEGQCRFKGRLQSFMRVVGNLDCNRYIGWIYCCDHLSKQFLSNTRAVPLLKTQDCRKIIAQDIL